MKGVNKCIFVGYVGKDPDIRYSKAGNAVANFSVAVSEKWKDTNGEKKERTEWVQCAAFGKLAEIVEKYVNKGSLVYVEGRMQTKEYNGKYYTNIALENMTILKQPGGQQSGNEQEDMRSNEQESLPYDDDIPF